MQNIVPRQLACASSSVEVHESEPSRGGKDGARNTTALVDVKTLADKFGPPPSWWYAQAEAGKIPSYRLGKYRRFRVAEIEAWIEAQRQGPGAKATR